MQLALRYKKQLMLHLLDFIHRRWRFYISSSMERGGAGRNSNAATADRWIPAFAPDKARCRRV